MISKLERYVPKKCQPGYQKGHKGAKMAASTKPLHCLRLSFCQAKPSSHSAVPRTTAAATRTQKHCQGFPAWILLVANQFFVTSCWRCPQDQTAAVRYYWGQNISTNSYFLRATDGRKQHWQQCSLVLQCSTFKVQLPLILNEECNKAIPHVWTLSCCSDMQPPVPHAKKITIDFFSPSSSHLII